MADVLSVNFPMAALGSKLLPNRQSAHMSAMSGHSPLYTLIAELLF